MAITKEDLENLKKEDEKVIDIQYVESGTDESGYPVYKIDYINPPTNFKLVKMFEALKVAILQDLDYVAEPTI